MTNAHQFTTRVYYEDTDMAGIVYHANYLKFIERARSDWVREMGIDQLALREQGMVFVVRHMDINFLAPARFDEVLQIETRITQKGRSRLVLNQQITRDGQGIFRADVTLVMINSAGKPVKLPDIIPPTPQ